MNTHANIFLSLLTQGYLPKELPPCFSSVRFGVWAQSWTPAASNRRPTPSYHPVTHSLARAGGVRRILSVPHPDAFLRLSWEIANDWPSLQAHCQQSAFSRSRPVIVPLSERALVPETALGDLSVARIRHRRGGRYVLAGDISEFYRSLYTHSIPWALHTKEIAKVARRDRTLLGNRLDEAVRMGQDQQTNGIPIGPDTSLVIGEVVLAAVDTRLRVLNPHINGFRFYDDFEFTFSRRSDAEQALQHLQEALSDYNLQLNPLKTRVIELPQRVESPWLLEFRDYEFRSGHRNSIQRIIRFFDQAFDFHNQHRDSYVLAYAISRIQQEEWTANEWQLVQDLLLQAVSVELSAAQQFVTTLLKSVVRGRPINQSAVAEVLNLTVDLNAHAGHSNEAAWALWCLLVLRLPISSDAASSIQRSRDVFVNLLGMDANHQGLVEGGLDLSQWAALADPEELGQDRWLLSYEMARHGWIAFPGAPHYSSDPLFSALAAANVSFYSPVTSGSVTDATITSLRRRRAQSYDDSTETDDDEDEESNEDDSDEEEYDSSEEEEYDPSERERDYDEGEYDPPEPEDDEDRNEF